MDLYADQLPDLVKEVDQLNKNRLSDLLMVFHAPKETLEQLQAKPKPEDSMVALAEALGKTREAEKLRTNLLADQLKRKHRGG